MAVTNTWTNNNIFPWLTLEETNIIKQQSQSMTSDPFQQKIIQDDLYGKKLNTKKHNQFVNERQKGRMEIKQRMQDSKTEKEKNTNNSIDKMGALADIYRQYGYEHGKNWDNMPDEELISRFNSKNPQAKKYSDSFLMGDGSEYELVQQLGLASMPKKELEETTGEKIADVWVGFLQSPWKRGYNMIGQWMDRLWKRGAEQLEGSDLQKRVQEKAIDLFWEDEVKAYQESVKQSEENWTTFNGREATDIRTPLLWEERANSAWTKWGEIAWDIATWIWVTAPMAVATAPIYASSTALGAWILGASEGAVWTLLGHYGAEWDLNISPTEALLGVWGGAVWGKVGNWLANKGSWIRKEAENLIAKSIKPTVKWKQSQTDYNKFIDDTMDVWNFMSKNKGLLQYTDEAWDVVNGKLPTTMKETRETLWNLKKTIFDTYNSIAQEAWDKGARVNLTKVVEWLDEKLNDVAQNIGNPNTKNIIKKYKEALKQYTDEAWTLSIEDAQKITQIYNQKLNAFFKNPNMNDVHENSIIAQINKGIKDGIDESIETAFTDAINKWSVKAQEYQKLKSMYGKVKTIEDEVAKRALVEARKNAKGLWQQVIDSLAGGELTEALLTANPIGMAKAWTMNLISKWYNYINSPDTNIRKLFQLIDKENGKLSKVGNKLDDVANATDNVANTERFSWKIENPEYNQSNLNLNNTENGLLQDSWRSPWSIQQGGDLIWQQQGNERWGIWKNSEREVLNDGWWIWSQVWWSTKLVQETDTNKIVENLERIKASQPDGYKMDIHSAEDYTNYKTFQSPDWQSSVTVKPDWDITSLVSMPWLWRWKDLLLTAIENGWNKLDCYEQFLPWFYAKWGFIPVARVKFNPQYAPKDWKWPWQDIIVMMKNDWLSAWETANKRWNFITPKKLEENLKNLPEMEYDQALQYRDSLMWK